MSIRTSVIVNLVVQAYAAVIGVLVLPIYLHHMGAEAYGLVGFYVMLQAWAAMLDMGLSPMLTRELARFKAGVLPALDAAKVVRSLEWLFMLMAFASVLVAVCGKNWAAIHWLQAGKLPVSETSACVAIMGGMIGLRWLVGLYRSGLIGLDRLISIGLINAVITTTRTFGVLAVLLYVSNRPLAFFEFQLFIAFFEVLILAAVLYFSVPVWRAGLLPGLRNNLRSRFGFAGGMAYLAVIWAAIMQIDKLALSHWLSLTEYGYFSIAIAVASGVMLVSVAFVQSMQPRITILVAQQDQAGALRLFRLAMQFVTAGVVSIGGVLLCHGELILYAWTHNAVLASRAGLPLGLYGLGNAVYAMAGVAFVLQFASGQTRPHVRAISGFAVVWIPALVLAAFQWGGNGSGAVWLLGNLLFLLFWMAPINSDLFPSLGKFWIIGDFAVVALASILPAAITVPVGLAGYSRLTTGVILALLAGVSFLAGLVSGSQTRPMLMNYLRKIAPLRI